MGKNTKVMPQNVPLSILFLGKGRESLHLKPYEKLSLQARFMTCSAAHTKLDKVSMMHLKIAQAIFRKQTSMRMVLYLLQQTNLCLEGTLQDPQILFENSVLLQTQQMQTMYFLLSAMVQMYIS